MENFFLKKFKPGKRHFHFWMDWRQSYFLSLLLTFQQKGPMEGEHKVV